MPPIGELRILLPVDVSSTEPPTLAVLDVLRPFEVVLLGYFPVPDQAEPALLKHEYEDEAGARLDRVAAGRPDLIERLVFTHDRGATIDRVADQYDCDAVLTAGDTDHLDRILVPVRGDHNIDRIASVVAGLLDGSEATATFFHSVDEDGERGQAEELLRGAIEAVTAHGVDGGRLDWSVSAAGDPHGNIVDVAGDYDLVVFGETEPSLRDRIMGETLSATIDRLTVPALVVRDVE